MKTLKPRFIQIDCREINKLDLRQARAVLKYKPDIIILEYPNNKKTPDTIFNKYTPANKPLKNLPKFSKETFVVNPWVKSDVVMWNNIAYLWTKEKRQALVYSVDAPSELVREWFYVWENMYPCALKNWLWWTIIYLRECYMAKNVRWILSRYQLKKRPTVLIFLQSFHWEHVKFLLRNPSAKQIWNYYFGKFDNLRPSIVAQTLKKQNKIFYKHWKIISDFRIKS